MTTTTDTTAVDTTADADTGTGVGADQVVTVKLTEVAANVENIRRELGDLTDLTRSIKASGVLVPLLVLPANSDGIHSIVAGHRRYQAAVNANISGVPILIRDLTPVQILDAMLIENSQRSEISTSDQIRAIARYQYLDPTSTPAKIARRIGRTPAWVKTRLEIACLPIDVLDGLDTGTLTLTAASALATVVDLGDDAVRAAAEHVAGQRRQDDPADVVARWRRRHEAERRVEQLLTEYSAKGGTVYATINDARAAGAVGLGWDGLNLDDAGQKAHRREPCHAVSIKLDWNDKVTMVGYCTDRDRHRGTTRKPAESAITSTPASNNPPGQRHSDRDKQIAKARSNRHTAAATLFSTGKLAKTTAINFAALTLIDSLDSLAVKKVIKWMGLTCGDGYGDAHTALTGWLDNGGEPSRLLAALAAAHLETRGSTNTPLPTHRPNQLAASQAWLTILTDHAAYTPDEHDLPTDQPARVSH